jgi:hypothetical protein
VVAQRALCAAVEVASHVLPARFWRLGTLLMAICGEHENKLGDQKLADPASFWRVLLGVSPLLASARTYWPDRNDLAHFVLLRNSYIGALTQAAAGAVCLSERDRASKPSPRRRGARRALAVQWQCSGGWDGDGEGRSSACWRRSVDEA